MVIGGMVHPKKPSKWGNGTPFGFPTINDTNVKSVHFMRVAMQKQA
jgi:hypothetical protein